MWTIHVVLATAVVLGAAVMIWAQGDQPVLQGLPEYGVTLSGTPGNPVVENHSGRVVIGYDIKSADVNGRGMAINQILAPSVLPAGIPDGGAVYALGNFPVNSNIPMPNPPQVRSAVQGPIVKATLRSVIFVDGQFMGTDEPGAFEQLGKKIKGVSEVGKLAKTQAWDEVEALAQAFGQLPRPLPPSGEDNTVYTFRHLAASRLVETRKFKGDAAAAQLAELYSSLPTLWR